MVCCCVNDVYLLTKVKAGSLLNVRQEPHPLSAIVATLGIISAIFHCNDWPKKARNAHLSTLDSGDIFAFLRSANN